MGNRIVTIGRGRFSQEPIRIGNALPFVLIAGPCQMETRDHTLKLAERIKRSADNLGIAFVFKASYDKANRTSGASKRGPGLSDGLRWLEEVRDKVGVPVTTDVHSEDEAHAASMAVDMIQTPALLSRQTDLLEAAGRWGSVVNIKKGQFMAPEDMKHAAAKVIHAGCSNVVLTERGTSFGYHRLVNDMTGLAIMRGEIDHPVVFDATHSVQSPAGLGGASGGNRDYVPLLARAAVAAGVAGVFMEVHEDPDRAPSDGPCMLKLEDLDRTLAVLQDLDAVVKLLA